MPKTTRLELILAMTLTLALSSCGGGGSSGFRASNRGVDPLSIVTTQMAAGSVGKPYSSLFSATGGSPPYTWSIALGKLPSGLSLNATTGYVTGTPTEAGKFSFTLEVTDSTLAQQQTAMDSEAVTINPPPLVIMTTSLPEALMNQPYSLQLQASGGVPPYTWSITSGALPVGLSLDAITGEITGIPTSTGVFSVTIAVTDSSAPQSLAKLSIGSRPASPRI